MNSLFGKLKVRIIREDDKSIQLFERDFKPGLVNIDHSSLQLDHDSRRKLAAFSSMFVCVFDF